MTFEDSFFLYSVFYPKHMSQFMWMLLKLSSIIQTVRVFEDVCEDTVKMSAGNAVEVFFHVLGGLTLADCQIPTKLLCDFPSSTGHGEKIRCKSSWIEIQVGSTLSCFHHRRNRLEGINLLPVKLKRNKTQNDFPAYHTFPCSQLLSNSASSLIRHWLSTGCKGFSALGPDSPPCSPSFPLMWVSVG